MKNWAITTTALITIFSLIVTLLNGQNFNYEDSWGPDGLTLKKVAKNSFTVNFSIQNFNLIENEIDGETLKNIIMSGAFLPNDEGMPDLPGFSRYIALPQGAKASLVIKSYRTETFQDIVIAPAPRIPLDTDRTPLSYKRNNKVYSTNQFYPENPFQLSSLLSIRGVDAVILGITPFQYNPVTKQLIVYRDVEVEVVIEGGNGAFGDDRLRSRWFDPILSDLLLNYQSLPVIDYDARMSSHLSTDATGCEYLIVIPNSSVWLPYAQQLSNFRNKQGILTQIVTLSQIGGSTTTILENYFNNAYNNWDIPPVAVLLMADYGTDANTSIVSPIWNSYCVSDNIYADVDGNSMPDIVFARMTAQNATHLQTMVSKMINYETNPPTDYNFYHKPITALGWQTERWFQICSEVMGGFWREEQGKNPVRINAIYEGTPGTIWSSATNTTTVVNYFGPSGLGYIPATPSQLGGWSGGTAQMVVTAINDGAFALQHRDHGGETGWGEPAFTSSNISSLNNTANNELVFVFSINCLTGKYNYGSECFAEKFHRYTYGGQNAGALGLIAASEVSYSFVNDVYQWGAMDNLEPTFMPAYGSSVTPRGFLPAFGNAAGKYFLQQSNWPYNTSNKEVTYNLFHHHGGAFLTVYTQVPQNLTVQHNPVIYSGATTFSVTANSGSLIALSLNNQIIGTATGTGSPVSIQIPSLTAPSEILVTVTKQNYFRYQSTVEVLPPSGPYVVFDSYQINDFTDNNGNGLLDYGENVLLHITLKNVGVANASGVTGNLSSSSSYVSLSQGTCSFGNIAAGTTKTINNAYEFDVSTTIPDGENVPFQIVATDASNNSWTSYFTITAHAPELVVNGYTVNDQSGNNNGILDPGETAPVVVYIINNGSSAAYNISGMLASASSYVSVVNPGPFSYNNLEPGQSAGATYTLSASSSIPAGHVAQINVSISSMYGLTFSDVIEFTFADYCTATTSQQDEYIANVAFGSISKSSGWQGGVANYTNLSTTLTPGVAVPITITNGNAWAADKVTVWIDWNMNVAFDQGTNEEFVLTNVGGAGLTYTGNITAPANQFPRLYRMRIRMVYNTTPAPCGSSTYGEVEDYSVIIAGTTLPPTNLTAVVSNQNVQLDWNVPLSGSPLGYNVYRNNTLIAGQISPTEYLDQNLQSGSYSYTVCAVYSNGISDPAGPVTVEIGYPLIWVSPGSFEISMDQNTVSYHHLSVSNDGNLPLNYSTNIYYDEKDVVGWLTITANGAGIVNPEQSVIVIVSTNATSMNPGIYYAAIEVVSNDPTTPSFIIPVTLTVIEVIQLNAGFTASPLEGQVPLTVQFTDESTGGAVSWEWDFDHDGVIDSYDQNPEWEYSIIGYYTVSLTIYNAESLTDTEIKEDYILANLPDPHFAPVWITTFNPMNIFVKTALLDGENLQPGDEIGLFDIDPFSGNEICVGAGIISEVLTGNIFLNIVASMDDGTGISQANGFTPGNPIIYKYWNYLSGEFSNVTATYPYPEYDEIYTSQGTAIVELDLITAFTQNISLNGGWNLASFNIQPDNMNLLNIVQPLINQNQLFKVINESGGSIFYLPFPPPAGQWSNTIGNMCCTEGYYIRVNGEATLNVTGEKVALPMNTPLFEGWNMMGYPCTESQNALQCVQPLIDEGILYKVIDETGGAIFHLPFPPPQGQWSNTIGNFETGKGYYIKVTGDATLVFNNPTEKANTLVQRPKASPSFFQPVYENNPFMPMLVALDANGWMQAGDEVGIFDGEVCVGAGMITENSTEPLLITCSLDDPETEDNDGFQSGEPLIIKTLNHLNQQPFDEVQISFIMGDQLFTPLGTHIARIEYLATGITAYHVPNLNVLVIPNPLNDKATIVLTLPSDGQLQLSVTDIFGKTSNCFFDDKVTQGLRHVNLEAGSLAPGFYFLKYLFEGSEKEVGGYIRIVVLN